MMKSFCLATVEACMNYHRVYTLLDSHTRKLFLSYPNFCTWPVNLINIRTNSEHGGQSVNAENSYHTFQWVALPQHRAKQDGG